MTTGAGIATRRRAEATVEAISVSAYTIPTDYAESDGTLEWDRTTLVLVEATGAGRVGLGYTYADTATAELIRSRLADVVISHNTMAPGDAFVSMVRAIRNLGRPGICSMAISAIDTALWDLKARLLDLPLVTLLGPLRHSVALYGSGGFTSYPVDRLQAQLGRWAAEGFTRVKMKIGREPSHDVERVAAARAAIGDRVELFIDANGAYTRKQALAIAEGVSDLGVSWFEEPVSSDDLEGLRLLRDRAPATMDIAAGEYGYDLPYFERMLDAGAVDVLQADVTRCGGITGFLAVAALCNARGVPLSAHTAPALHAHVCCAAPRVAHVEYFHDHVRIEHLLFDGVPRPVAGTLTPDLSRPGMGLDFKRADAARYTV
jgi:L-alanine-DL-glutamate epimerase-like enolase superfamily enzyme